MHINQSEQLNVLKGQIKRDIRVLFGSNHWHPLFSALKRTQRRVAKRVEEVNLQTTSLFVKPLARIVVR